MKIFKRLIVFLILSAVLLFSVNAYATPTPTPTPPAIETIDTSTKATITNDLLTEANQWGITNLSNRVIYGTRNDLFATFAVVTDLETYQTTDFESGPVLVGFAYIKATTVSNIPAGYYRIEVQKNPGTETGIAILSDQYRLHTYTITITITIGAWISYLVPTLYIGWNFIVLDIHWSYVVITITITVTPPTPTPTRRVTPTPTRRRVTPTPTPTPIPTPTPTRRAA